MKKFLSVLTLAAVMASCTSTPNNTGVTAAPQTPAVDTAGLAQFQAFKRQQELMRLNENNLPEETTESKAVAAPTPAPKAVARRSTAPSSSTNNRTYSPATESGSMSSTSGNTAQAKKDWSKAAKGTAIGAGSGAVLGAVINKKNRAVGGVVGGVAGGAVGYGIGRGMDKRDGRY